MTPNLENRLLTVAFAALAILLIWVALLAFVGNAKADSLHVTFGYRVPTVPGIEASPSPHRWYDAKAPRVRYAPRADVIELDAPAPANRCGPHAFEVISGPPAGRGCYGAR